VVLDEWLPENGFLTPTLKIKRAKLEETYGVFNDDWYAAKKPVIWQR
jgi:long-chain acyl-CoA synthetase